MDWGFSITRIFGMLIPIVAIVGAFVVAGLKIYSHTRLRELEIKQRIAMIEKGLVPPPEVDPGRFEESLVPGRMSDRGPAWARYRRSGVILMGVGLGLMVLIGMAGESPNQGLGVGGFVAVLGLAFWLAGWIEAPRSSDRMPRSSGSGPSGGASSDPPAPHA